MKHQLVWFRNDLRLHDHEPLSHACAAADRQGGKVAAIYVLDTRGFGTTSFGFDRIGTHRKQFLLQALRDLQLSLSQVGAALWVAEGDSVEKVAEVAESIGAGGVYFHQEPAPESKSLECALRDRLEKLHIPSHASPPGTLYDSTDLPFPIEGLPETFTSFRKRMEARAEVPSALSAPDRIAGFKESPAPSAAVQRLDSATLLYGLEDADRTALGVLPFEGGETAGLRRIDDYFWNGDHLRHYKATRNGMLGADYSSKFSPWLAMGCISPRHVHEEVKRYESSRVQNESTYWLIFELLWRDYFALIMEKHQSKLFDVGGLRQLDLPWNQDWELFDRWRRGVTGYPLIDANMRELAATGFMSNRGRQNVASFLTKNLGVDWRMGAEWFESQLIDHDPCSNYGNWNYVAGVGNDARGFRWFNTLKQAENYDPTGAYVRHWLPELSSVPDAFVHSPWRMDDEAQRRSGCRIGSDYPEPIVALEESATRNRTLYRRVATG